MTSLPMALVLQLAVANAPQVAPENIAAFAMAESKLQPYAIFDNAERKSYAPDTAQDAATIARRLLAQGHSIDAGLMQINSANFRITGLTPETAFDPAQSIRAGAQIMVEAFQRCREREITPDPLRCMASIYNTGKPTAGETNGYVVRVFAAADQLVPAIRQAVPAISPSAPERSQAPPPHACGPPPPAWDSSAVYSFERCVSRSQNSQKERPENEDQDGHSEIR